MTVELVVPYIIGFVGNIIAAGMIWDDGNKTLGARIGLLTPVWPVSLVYGVYILIVFLWKHAELELRKDRT